METNLIPIINKFDDDDQKNEPRFSLRFWQSSNLIIPK